MAPHFLLVVNLFPGTKSRDDQWKICDPLNFCYGLLEHGIIVVVGHVANWPVCATVMWVIVCHLIDPYVIDIFNPEVFQKKRKLYD